MSRGSGRQRAELGPDNAIPWRSVLATAAAAGALLPLAASLADLYVVGRGEPGPFVAVADVASSVCSTFAALLVLVSPLLPIVALIEVCRRRAKGRVLVASLMLPPLLALGFLVPGPRDAAFRDLAARSAPLVQAVRNYEAHHGQPPPSLEALVPQYLAEVPGTGLRAYPEYQYERVEGSRREWIETTELPVPEWELCVPCSQGMSFDVFFYWPTEQYPDMFYGGWIERMGDWAYVHE